MKKIVFIACFFTALGAFAQTGIGTTTPDASARLEVSATNKGFLPPRVALTASNTAGPITSPATGLLVYNTATAGTSPNNVSPGYYYWNGTAWETFVGNSVNSVGAISGTSTANGASISGGALSLAPADATNAGVVTTGTQTFAGSKTFNSAAVFSSTLGVTGNLTVNTDKFTVTAASGNVSVGGNLTGASSGSSTISGFSAALPAAQSGTTYTLAASDNGKVIQFTNANAITLTLPSSGLPAGFNCMVVQMGNGQITFSGGATIYNRNSFTKTAGLYSIVTVLYLTASTAITSGEMTN